MIVRKLGDAIAYVRVLCNPLDDLAFELTLLIFHEGIGSTTPKSSQNMEDKMTCNFFHSAENS